MQYKTIEYKSIEEKMHVYEHESGLKVFVIPKAGYQKKFATFSTNFGSINNQFFAPEETVMTEVPNGVAHFLEHKLFEQIDGSVMDKFAALGASPNAYTSFSQTVYLFSCTENFDQNFDLLLNFVQNPYITQKSVDKEKGIIGQEIKMYQDNPSWRVFFNLLHAMYVHNPVKLDIAGTVESISLIDRDILMKCYKSFYAPENMIVLVVGDVDEAHIFAKVIEKAKPAESHGMVKKVTIEDEKNINMEYVEQELPVSMPLFQMGIRDNVLQKTGIESAKHEEAVKILLEMLFGKSTKFYNEIYEKGFINSTFSFDYTMDETFAFSIIGGESQEPQKLRSEVVNRILESRQDGLNEEAFKRIKRSFYGKFVKQMNSPERISHTFISVYFRGINIFDYQEVYDKMTFEYINKVFIDHFIIDNMALSVIKPMTI